MKKLQKPISLIVIALVAPLCVVGCSGKNMSPDMSDNMKDDRDSGTYTLIFREWKSSLYKVEYEGRTYIMNTNGGVCEVKE